MVPKRRRRGTADGQGRRLGAGPVAERRGSAVSWSSAWRRSARSGTPEHGTMQPGQGGPEPLARHSPDGARIRHEPARSSARRWRGQGAGWWPAADQVGQAGDGQEDPSQQEYGPLHRSQARKQVAYEPITKKGPYIDPKLFKKIEALNAVAVEGSPEDLVARLVDLPGDGWAHAGGPRWPPARPDLRHGKHGRAQARRVCADAHVPRPHRARREVERRPVVS